MVYRIFLSTVFRRRNRTESLSDLFVPHVVSTFFSFLLCCCSCCCCCCVVVVAIVVVAVVVVSLVTFCVVWPWLFVCPSVLPIIGLSWVSGGVVAFSAWSASQKVPPIAFFFWFPVKMYWTMPLVWSRNKLKIKFFSWRLLSVNFFGDSAWKCINSFCRVAGALRQHAPRSVRCFFLSFFAPFCRPAPRARLFFVSFSMFFSVFFFFAFRVPACGDAFPFFWRRRRARWAVFSLFFVHFCRFFCPFLSFFCLFLRFFRCFFLLRFFLSVLL